MTNRIDLVRPDAPALARPVPHPVGVTTLRLERPDEIDIAASGERIVRGPRRLTVELWYPAAAAAPPTPYATILRDGATPVVLHGRAARDAAAAPGRHALVILSHGYPGNRFLMAHVGEHLAAHGYAVASIDHPQSTYDDHGPFAATLWHRPRDQAFVLDALAGDPRVDAARTAVIGYSMGGYGALVFGGAGVTAAGLALPGAPPHGIWAGHAAGSETHAALRDPRLAAVVAIGPWTGQGAALDAPGLAVPLLMIAGDRDAITGYGAMRAFWKRAHRVPRWLLTFHGAGHNAAAPIPAPDEGWAISDRLGWAPHAHHADGVWDTVRMNDVARHIIAAFLARHLRNDTAWPLDPARPDTDWPGFPPGTTAGLRLERRWPDALSRAGAR